ncbi:hypothetical protein QTG56_24925 (plasmid) [Rossellomorea sp. AcN35-11]|nr:hypothetical protein [Rossellomorea aquimaris]WJV31879.1 hypothetical protein QTG56_24925 [Rossellomorea sp. AcN35-11]
MKRNNGLVVPIAIIFIAILFFMLNSNFELGKYGSLEEAIAKTVPYDVKDIIYTDVYEGVTIVLYSATPDQEEVPHLDRVEGVAFYTGNDKEGWRNIGSHGWFHYENNNMTVYDDRLRHHDSQGKTIYEFHVVFGEINNPDIVKVETKAFSEVEGSDSFTPAKIINHSTGRFYFKVGEETTVRGLSENGEVIVRQGG